MTTPFFSIIIPTLNEEKYIWRLLEDLVRQKKTDFEVIIVDGGSTDSTLKVIQAYIRRLPLTFYKSQAGVSRQRNFGVEKAQGEYLIFFDADIQVSPKFLFELKRQITLHGSDVFTTYVRQDSRNVYDEVIAKLVNKIMDMSVVIDRPFIPGFNFIIKKSVFLAVNGFDSKVVMGEDYDLSLRLFKRGHETVVLKRPVLTFSLRRFRKEGRLSLLRKNAQAGLYFLTRGAIKKDLFNYPMKGGAFYNDMRSSERFKFGERYFRKLLSIFLD